MNAARNGRRPLKISSINTGVLRAAIAFGMLSAGAFLMDARSSTAVAGPFPGCNEDMYIMRAEEGATVRLNKVDVANQFALIETPHPGFLRNYNTAGYNKEDNFIYAFTVGPFSNLLRLHSDGGIEEVPTTIPSSLAGQGSNSGEVGPGGMMYILGFNGRLYRLNLNDPSAPDAWWWVNAGSHDGIADIGYYDNALYGVNDAKRLVKIDLSTAVWTPVSAAPGTVTKTVIGTDRIDTYLPASEKFAGSSFGAMFGGSNGLYGNYNGGGFFMFDTETGHVTRLADSGPTTMNDGAKCYDSALRLPSDIRLTKTSYPDIDAPQPSFAPGTKTQYRVTLTNYYTIGIAGIQLYDPLPPGVTSATWRCENKEADPSFQGCEPATGTGPLDAIISIGPNDAVNTAPEDRKTVSYIVEIDVPADIREPLVNTATMIMPELSYQSNDEPQTATVTKIPALLTVEKAATWEDTDKSNIANVGDHINYVFTVTNSGDVPLTDIHVVDPLVTVEPASWPSLQPGESTIFTARYAVVQEDIDNNATVNTATARGMTPTGSVTESPPSTAEVQFPPAPKVATEKSGRFLDDIIANEFPDEGEHLEYTVSVKNSGNVTMVVYPPVDSGPTLNGKPMKGALSAFSPDLQIVPPGGEGVFTALYTLTTEDISEGAGLLDGVQNSVETPVQTLKEYLDGKPASPVMLDRPNILTLPGYAINKQASTSTATKGQIVPYVITVRPVDVSGKAMLVDMTPSGFNYMPGSGRVAGKPVEPKVEGRMLTFDLDVEPDKDTKVEYALVVTGAVGLGTYRNTAQIFQSGQMSKPVSLRSEAEVEVIPDPLFDCGDIIGTVFNDSNRNGYQDKGEVGLPGARVTTLGGMLVTTDAHGRFNVACADLPNGRIGSTFLMKLDPRSLPTGYRILSENPRSVRLTAGKVQRINFAASVGRVVRLDVNDAAFRPGEAVLRPEWHEKLLELVDLLEAEPSVLRLSYVSENAERSLAGSRLSELRSNIVKIWRQKPDRYRLEIEARMTTSFIGLSNGK